MYESICATLYKSISANLYVFLVVVVVVVVVLRFYVPPTAKVIRRRDIGLKSHPKDRRSPGSNLGPLVYKECSLTARYLLKKGMVQLRET